MQSRWLKLSMYTTYGKRKRPINFHRQRSNFKVFDSCGQDIASILQYKLLKLSMYTSYRKREKHINCQGHWAFIKKFSHLDHCGQGKARTMQSTFLKFSRQTSYGKREMPFYFQSQRSNFKVIGPL